MKDGLEGLRDQQLADIHASIDQQMNETERKIVDGLTEFRDQLRADKRPVVLEMGLRKMVRSTSEARRLVSMGAVHVNGNLVTEMDQAVTQEDEIRIGK